MGLTSKTYLLGPTRTKGVRTIRFVEKYRCSGRDSMYTYIHREIRRQLPKNTWLFSDLLSGSDPIINWDLDPIFIYKVTRHQTFGLDPIVMYIR